MKLIEFLDDIAEMNGGIHFDGLIKQYGGAAIFNADVNGEQKTMEALDGDVLIPYISSECLTNGIFHHRMKNNPKNAVDSKKPKLEDVRELFDLLKEHQIQYRGGIIASKVPCNSTKSFRVSRAKQNPKKEFVVTSNDRLGIMADEGKNDYPRRQYLYEGCEFIFHSFLDLEEFHPKKNGLVKRLCEVVDELGDKELVTNVKEWICEVYFIKDDKISIEELENDILNRLLSYNHPVHKRYNSFLLFDKDIKVTHVKNQEEQINYLNKRS